MSPFTELDIQQNPRNRNNTNIPKRAASASIVGETNYPSEKCKLKDAVCYHCMATGHIKAKCRKLKSVAVNGGKRFSDRNCEERRQQEILADN
ncbi:hypothetical protein DPMN_139093 [Dreissena polymorpha]|uniref:CCHC-type domain-containing protein n=1 Tax=Dreissena polymorpha TaxID=45954 RepID=A0A9D4JKG2_DREPO|nr:hypothetical protein DPMN_139093 [Dreissena polymorpha]